MTDGRRTRVNATADSRATESRASVRKVDECHSFLPLVCTSVAARMPRNPTRLPDFLMTWNATRTAPIVQANEAQILTPVMAAGLSSLAMFTENVFTAQGLSVQQMYDQPSHPPLH
jgi:hypothetical protein